MPATPSPASGIPTGRMPAIPPGPSTSSTATITTTPFKSNSDAPEPDRTKPARESMLERLSKSSTPAAEPPPATRDVKPPNDPADIKPDEESNQEEPKTEDVPRGTTNKTTDPSKPADKRKNPWKLYEEEKKARAATETELQRLKSERIPEQDRTALTERAAKAEKRAQELEDHMRFVDYQQSSEFKAKYEQPYVEAWNQAVSELSEITAADATAPNGERPVSHEDIWKLVNLPLGTAQSVAEEAFGKFAGTAMQHRAAIKKLLTERNKAVEDAKVNGSSRIKQQQEAMQAQTKQAVSEITSIYKSVTDEIMKDPASSEFLKPFTAEEGKELGIEQKEWNEFLEKGYKLVDDGWTQNPLKPGLKPEERRDIIAKHAAIRNRAAAFGPLKRAHKRALKQIAEMQKQLDGYKGNAPSAGGSRPTNGKHVVVEDARNAFQKRLESQVRR